MFVVGLAGAARTARGRGYGLLLARHLLAASASLELLNELAERQTGTPRRRPAPAAVPSPLATLLRQKPARVQPNADKNPVDCMIGMGDIDELVSNALLKNKHDDIKVLLSTGREADKIISEHLLRMLFVSYSDMGRPDRVTYLQDYCRLSNPTLLARNGDFSHFLAKAHCLRGNSEKGLSLLDQVYTKHKNLRNVYRVVFREMIQDSVSNRSEASMVIFKKHLLSFSERWKDHYPLVCFWHACWASSWFSDQRLADELMDTNEPLKDIIKDRATALSLTVLRFHKEDDAVVRLLQALLKYKMMTEYGKVLQILFDFRLKKTDMRGCAEILQNCAALGIPMNSSLQQKYIHMLIDGDNIVQPPEMSAKPQAVQNFKLKF